MDEEKIQILFDTFRDELSLKSIDNFKTYLSDPTKRKMFYDEIIQPRYPGNSFEESLLECSRYPVDPRRNSS